MGIELKMLVFCSVLGFVQILLAAHSAGRQRGYAWVAGRREETVAPLTGYANIFNRALANFLESFPLFVALVVAAVYSGRLGQMSDTGALLFFFARVLYVPLYGVPIVRSLVWNVGAVGMLLVGLQVLIPEYAI